jgi:hypothetical protein
VYPQPRANVALRLLPPNVRSLTDRYGSATELLPDIIVLKRTPSPGEAAHALREAHAVEREALRDRQSSVRQKLPARRKRAAATEQRDPAASVVR